MNADYYKVGVTIVEHGKQVKKVLTVFSDEYVYDEVRTSINWGIASCETGMLKVKGFIGSSDKPYIAFRQGDECSPQFVIDLDAREELLKRIKLFGDAARLKSAVNQAEAALRNGTATQNTAGGALGAPAADGQGLSAAGEGFLGKDGSNRNICDEKKERIAKEVERCRAGDVETVEVSSLVQKAAAVLLDNPYRILGIKCTSSNEEANTALDKLKKLARLNAIASYKSDYDISGIARPVRDLSIAQNALAMLKDKNHKLFWFLDADACIAWRNGKYRIELARDGQEYGTYDLFLANLLYAMVCDKDFTTAETWKRVLSFYGYICRQSSCELLLSRFSETERKGINKYEVLSNFKKTFIKTILLMCERDDLEAVLRLNQYINACENTALDDLSKAVLGKVVSWFTDKEAALLSYLKEADSEDVIPDSKRIEIRQKGDAYCEVVEPVLASVLRDLRGDLVRHDMVKQSYKTATYQVMYVLNKCLNKSDAIVYANKCFSYCNADDKKRIQNVFGEVNIVSVDWNIPHTGWNMKGDEYLNGRGCAQDYSQALYWYHKAADAGNMHAPNSIGLCYLNGYGVPRSEETAVTWFRKAFEAGNPQGAYNLAECYYEGKGVRKDLDSALKYWSEAAKLGYPSAEQRRNAVFSDIQGKRKNHRAKNHICIDLGFQMTTGPNMAAEVSVTQAAYVYLVNQQGYQNYLNGDVFAYQGGYAIQFPYFINIPSSNHWFIIVDNGDNPIGGISATAKVKRV